MNNNFQKQCVFLAVFLCAFLGVSMTLAYNQYLPAPPPSGEIRYAPVQSPDVVSPPPDGWVRTIPQQNSVPPIPPLDPKLKNFPLDLDLVDFTSRNPYPNEHCFFKVKGRNDIVEFFPIGSSEDEESYGVWNFPTGTCNLEANQCSYGKRTKVRSPFRNQKPPVLFVYDKLITSQYRGFPVIPYKDIDDIDFSQCMPTWNGFMEIDDLKILEYKPPKRDYSKQSCYHPFHAGYKGSIFCDSEKCQLTENQYCTQKNGQCFLNDYPIKTKSGKSVTTMENFVFINWNFCTDEEGALIPEDGGPSFEERFIPGCSYRIEAPNYHEKQYAGNIDFLIKCDENRCMGGGLEFHIKRKEYVSHFINDEIRYSKTPPLTEFLSIDWTCLDATKVRDYNKKLLCTNMNTDGKAPNCQLCYENKKFVYKGCTIPYDELGRRTDVPAEMLDYNLYEEAKFLAEKIQELQQENSGIDLEPNWFGILNRAISIQGTTIDEAQRYRLAFLIAEFRHFDDPQEKDVKKLRRQMTSFLTTDVKMMMDEEIEKERAGMCTICRTSKPDVRLSQPAIREACTLCDKK